MSDDKDSHSMHDSSPGQHNSSHGQHNSSHSQHNSSQSHHDSSHGHPGSHRRHHRHHRHKTESLSKIRRRSKLKYLIGAAVLAAVFAGVLITVTLLERSDNARIAAEEEAGSSYTQERIWADANTVGFDQGLFGFDHRMESFLFVGTDNSGNEEPAEGEEYHGAMADFLLLMVLDYTDNTYGFLQLDRNTITEITMLGQNGQVQDFYDMQICTAHWYGGNPVQSAENTVTAVATLLGDLQNIMGYYVLNMDDVGVLNSAVGGVEVTIKDSLSEDDPELQKGNTLTLTDEQAERYFRARMGVGGGTNTERMARQRAYMSSFFEKVGDLTKKDAAFYNKLWNEIRHTGETNMNGNSFSRIANMLLMGENKGTFTLKGETTEGYVLGDGIPHEEFYPDENAVYEVMNELYPLTAIEYEDLDGYETEDESDEDFFEDEDIEYEYETGIEWDTEDI